MRHHSLPVFFEKIKIVEDGRFTLAKVYIAHVGENRNRCYFSKEVLQSMIPSLTNIPILAYIKEDEDGNTDFGNHEKVIVKKGKQLYLKYKGHAYGVVPADNNARFEFRYGEDGIEREYLVCDVILWNKFDDVIEIIQDGNGFKSQSMELFPASVKGHQDKNHIFVFEEAQFEGLCLLGDDVPPAMISSTIELFSTSQEDYVEMLSEFNSYFSAIGKGENMEVTGKENIENDVNETEPQTTVHEEPTNVDTEPTGNAQGGVNDEGEEVEGEEETPADDNAEGAETFAKKDEEESDENEDEENGEEKKEDDEEEEKKEKFSVTFELSHDDIRTGLYQALNDHDEFGDKWFWISQVFDNRFIVEMEDEKKTYSVNYVKHENAVSIGEYEEVFRMFVNADEKTSIEQHRATITQMEAELASLKEFKDGIEYAEKEAKLNSYSHILDKESFDSIKENLKNFSLVDIEKEIGLLVLRGQAQFSAQNAGDNMRIGATGEDNKVNPYGSLQHYFSK